METLNANLSAREKFKVFGFILVIDQLCVSLTERLHAYETVRSRFGFLNHLEEMDAASLYASVEKLVEIYKDDLEPSLCNELIQFASLIDLYKKRLR